MDYSVLDIAQLVVAIVAMVLQIAATILARPLRRLMHRSLWSLLMALNAFVLLRRVLSIIEVGFDWRGNVYESVAVLVGLGVSVFMLLVVVRLRRHLEAERRQLREMAAAAINLATAHNDTRSLAYQLAVHFVSLKSADPKTE